MLAIRVIAAVLALLSVLPLWRMLPTHATGIAGVATAEAAANYAAVIWNGVLLALIPGLIAAFAIDSVRFEQSLARIGNTLTRASSRTWALCMALLATLLAVFVALVIMRGLPTLIDSFAQLLQARYFAAGKLAGPVLAGQEFWHIQQTIVTKNGWVSQYPPGYPLLLTLGMWLHITPFVGPVLYGVAAYFTALIADDVIESKPLARFASLLAAISPFMLGMAGAYMSHVPAAAFSCAALYYVLKEKPIPAGIFIGLLFATRPLTGVVAGLVAIAYAFVTRPRSRALALSALASLGALPFLIAVALYNAHFFGSPFRFGYEAALGPNAGLGFGIDPWGNRYGITEALGYTSAELTALSLFLLEVPLPLTLFIGLYFALSPSLRASVVLMFAWVCALVLANLFYWHHGLFMGPRMLADGGPLWVLLVTASVAGLIQKIRHDWLVANKYSVRAFALGGACAALLAGVLLFAPERLMGYSVPADVEQLLRAPRFDQPSLVFVHGGWTSRIGMRLAGHGMRLDSVETALRQNGTCTVHHFANQYVRGVHPDIRLDFEPRAERALRAIELSPGNRIRVANGERIDNECASEMASDTSGVVDVTPYIWQGDLPGLSPHGALWVRDLGASVDNTLTRLQPNRIVKSWSVR